jgi:hypothetical protein
MRKRNVEGWDVKYWGNVSIWLLWNKWMNLIEKQNEAQLQNKPYEIAIF